MIITNQLISVLKLMSKDTAIKPTHVSLYITLFKLWSENKFINPVSITRQEVMMLSKIASKVTYHKCIKLLHISGYIDYKPSYNSLKASQVSIPVKINYNNIH